ncbi:MAG: DNA repair protein RadC [Bacillota bacterium]
MKEPEDKNKENAAVYRVAIRDLPQSARPRERLWREGPGMLTETELLAIILRTGSRAGSALDLAGYLLGLFGGFTGLGRVSLEELSAVTGMGPAKAAQVAAALELGRRLGDPAATRPVITTPDDASRLVMSRMRHLDREEFRVILLDTKNHVIQIETVAVGTLNSTGVQPREVFKNAIRRSAAALILAHNHPSGDPTPTREDVALTRRLIQAGELVGIEILDHIIIGDNRYVSLKAEKLI